MVTFTFMPVAVVAVCRRCLAAGDGEASTTRGAAAVELVLVTVTVTDTPGARPSAGAAAGVPRDVGTTATSPCIAKRGVSQVYIQQLSTSLCMVRADQLVTLFQLTLSAHNIQQKVNEQLTCKQGHDATNLRVLPMLSSLSLPVQ